MLNLRLSSIVVIVAGLATASVFAAPCSTSTTLEQCFQNEECKWASKEEAIRSEKGTQLDLAWKEFANPNIDQGICVYKVVDSNRIVAAFDELKALFEEAGRFKYKIYQLKIGFEMMPSAKEVSGEIDDFFNEGAMWSHNQKVMADIADRTGIADFAKRDGFTLASVGGATTNMGYVKNEVITPFEPFALGTSTKDDVRRAKIDRLVSILGAQNRPALAMNSLSFCVDVPQGKSGNLLAVTPENKFTDLYKYKSGKVVLNEKTGKPEIETAKTFFNDLADAIVDYNQATGKNLKVVVYRDNPKNIASMLFNKWANSDLQEKIRSKPALNLKNKLVYSGNWGSGGLSIRRVINGVLGQGDAGKIYDNSKGGKVPFDQKFVIEFIKAVGELPKMYDNIADDMADAIFDDISKPEHREFLKKDGAVHVFIATTGNPRGLWEDELKKLNRPMTRQENDGKVE